MVNNTQTFTGRVLLDNKQAQQAIEQLAKSLEQVKKKRKEAINKGNDVKEYDTQIKQLNASLKALRTNQQQVNETLSHLSTASYKELNVAMRSLQKQLRSGAVERNSAEWKRLQQELKNVKNEMANINDESKDSVGVFGRLTNALNANWGAIVQLALGFGSLKDAAQSSIQSFADMEESMADVRKYTGQTDEQVRQMNDDFKKMDTRTSREQLNELAGAAGRLGITSKDMIEEFVDGADKINVALGDDLGEGAVDKIGKLAQMFGEDKTKGLRGAMLATGSAVNELAQNSSANAGYIVDFAADLSGVGIQAGMTQTQLMGLASALDQNMQEEATSSTVFSQLITKMYQDPAKFAKIAGIQVKEFTNLIKTDANQALMQFLESMKSKGGFAEMAPMFEEMNLNGTRAVGVLSAVASHLDQVKTAQDLAAQSYADGTSVLNEFAVQNNTVQAQLDKAKKSFQDITIELGSQLAPAATYAISTANLGIKALSVLITFTTTHIKQIAVVGTAITVCTALWYKEIIAIKLRSAAVAYTTALDKAYTATTALLRAAMVALQATWALVTKGVQGYTVVMRAAQLASVTNPWAALATVLTVVGVAAYGCYKYVVSYNQALHENLQSVKDAKAVAESQASIAKKVSEATIDERNKIDMLNKVIHSNAYTMDERRQAIVNLQKLVPEYHGAISKEGQLYNDNQVAIQNYIKELENAAMAEAIYERKVEINKKKLDLKQKESRIRGSLKAVDAERKAHPKQYESDATADGWTGKLTEHNEKLISNQKQKEIHTQRLQNNLSQQQTLDAEEKYLDSELQKNTKLKSQYKQVEKKNTQVTASVGSSATPISSRGTTGKGSSATDAKREAAERKAAAKRKAALKKELEDEKKNNDAQQLEATTLYSTGQIRLSEYNDRMAKIKEQGLQERMNILKKYGEAESEEYKRLGAEKEKIAADYEKRQTTDLEELETNRQTAEMNIRANYYNKDSDIYHDEDALNEALFLLDQNYLKDKQDLYLSSSDEYWQIAREKERNELQRQYELQEQYDKMVIQLRQEYLNLGNDQQMELELKGLEQVHNAGLVSEEEYQRMKMGIANKYATYAPDTNDQRKADVNTALDTAKKMSMQGRGSDLLSSDNLGSVVGGAMSAIKEQQKVNDNLEKLRNEDKISEQVYQDAKKQMNKETYSTILSVATAAFNSMNSLMSSASAYSQACSDLEVAKITKNYEKQIDAAGNNSTKKKKLEDKRDKEIAKAKTKANKKAMVMELAQAMAQTATGAISAYSSTMAGAPYPANLVLAPISAGIATAAGLLQVATIKKQHQAEQAGYYEGGFTGSGNWKKEVGVVHAGEFVANHNAVNNPQLMPALKLIDAAQRNNTVASLTAQDVSRAVGGGSTAVVAPVVNVSTDNEQVTAALDSVNAAVDQLNQQLAYGIQSEVVITGRNGFAHKWKEYQKMINNK